MRRLLLLTLLATSCGGAEATLSAPAEGPASVADPVTDEPFDCPVTLPGKGFVAAGTHPTPSLPGHVWYGTPDLYVPLPVDGDYGVRKGVWWSVNFPGGGEEPQPDLTVTYTRLDVKSEPVTTGGPGTNALTAEDGWFMMAGIDPDEPGCWEVVGRYKGAELTYVYER